MMVLVVLALLIMLTTKLEEARSNRRGKIEKGKRDLKKINKKSPQGPESQENQEVKKVDPIRKCCHTHIVPALNGWVTDRGRLVSNRPNCLCSFVQSFKISSDMLSAALDTREGWRPAGELMAWSFSWSNDISQLPGKVTRPNPVQD